MNDAGIARMTRLATPTGAGADRIARSGDGRRLAIVRRTDRGSTIDLLVAADGGWTPAGTVTLPGVAAVSIAWLE
jgi:hypothetical protein